MTKNIALFNRDDLIKQLAWEVSRNVVDHHRNVYSQLFKDAPSTLPISLRNGIYNEIASAIKCQTDDDIRKWITRSVAHRKEMQRLKRLGKKAEVARKTGNKKQIEEVLQELRK